MKFELDLRSLNLDLKQNPSEFHINEVNPIAFYLIEKNLQFQERLRQELLINHKIDTLSLDGLLEIKNDDGEVWGLIPPIVEYIKRTVHFKPGEGEIAYHEPYEIQIPIVLDGLHRVTLAKGTEKKTFYGISISGVAHEHRVYAHPNSWDQVKIFENTPKTKQEKKLYILDDCYALYRDFDVLGCGKPRGTSA